MKEIYFLSTLPSEININSIILIALCSIITTSIVSIYPASRAAKLVNSGLKEVEDITWENEAKKVAEFLSSLSIDK